MSDETRKDTKDSAQNTPRRDQTDKVKDLNAPEITERDAQAVKGGVTSSTKYDR